MKMLKLILIWLLVIVVLVIVGLVVFIKTFDVNRLRPQLISQAGAVLKRPVDFNSINLSLSLSRGLSLKISDMKIGDDPAFGAEPFLTVRDAAAGLDFLGFLSRRELTVTDIRIDAPRIVLIKNKEGRFNFETIGKTQAASDAAAAAASSSSTAAGLSGLPAIFISSVAASDGEITYIDRTFDPALEARLGSFAVNVTGFSLRERFPFTLEAAVLGPEKNVKIEGQARLNAAAGEVTVTGLKTTAELHKISMESVGKALPMLKQDALPQSLAGVVLLTVKELTAGPRGIGGLEADVSLAAGTLRLKALASPVSEINVRAHVTADKLSLETFSCRIAEGTVTGTGEIGDYLKAQDFSFEAAAQDVKVQGLLPPDAAPQYDVEGILALKARIDGKGFSSEALQSELSGTADVGLTKGVVRNFNALRAVLEQIAIIPGLAQRLHDELPDKFKSKFEQRDTMLSDISIPVVIDKGKLVIRNAELGSEDFMYKGAGEADFTGAYRLEGDFLILRELSSAMADSVKELGYLFNADGMIAIPLKVSGSAEGRKLRVDGEYMAKKLLTTQAGTQLINVIGKALGRDEGESGGAGAGASGQDSSSGGDIGQAVGSLLEGILGGQK